MGTKRSSNQLKAYLPVNLTDAGSAFLRLLISFTVLTAVACTQNTVNQTNPPVSQANPDTRISDPDDWGGAGTGDGGGGQGVQCGNKLMVRDIYEAKTNYRRTMEEKVLGPSGTDTVDDASIAHLISVLKNYYKVAAYEEEFVETKFWNDFVKGIVFIPDDAKLYASKDANSPLSLPQGCKIVQIAYWEEAAGVNSQGTLYVDKEKWLQLDQFNKVALLAHEYFFKMARIAGYKNSDYIRLRVGEVMSKEGAGNTFAKWVPAEDSKVADWLPKERKGFKYCIGYNDNPTDQLKLIQFEKEEGNQSLVISTIRAGDKILPPLRMQSLNFVSNKPYSKRMNALTDSYFSFDEKQDRLATVDIDEADLPTGVSDAIVFSIPFSTKDEVGSISFLNPMQGTKISDMEIKPQADLIVAYNRVILDLFSQVMTASPDADMIQQDLLATLHKEVDDAIAKGRYPGEFTRWKNSLLMLESQAQFPKEKVREVIYNNVPLELYRFKRGAYSAKQVRDAMGLAGFVRNKAKRAEINISVGAKSVDFKLICKSYDDIYKEITEGYRKF
ncbi:hypothetical protein [Bdellovibrio sp. HCB209]|uniref:hypothetical protein n=1 Tax=Bdellovibrio sp. HCB209 TaxID=3394354 RepID=UPI0039B59D89